jgi:predicted transcriptional regulator
VGRRARNEGEEKLLTEAELEIMNVLWELGEGSVADVMAKLPGDRAYTTVATLVKILEQKGFVSSRKDGKAHLFSPVTEKPEYEATSLRHLVKRVFGGDPSQLVRRLLSTDDVRPDDLERIKKLIEEE